MTFQLPMQRSLCLGPTRVQILCAASICFSKRVVNTVMGFQLWSAGGGEFSLLFERTLCLKPERTFFHPARCNINIVIWTIHFATFVRLLLVCVSPLTFPPWVALRRVENSRRHGSWDHRKRKPLHHAKAAIYWIGLFVPKFLNIIW